MRVCTPLALSCDYCYTIEVLYEPLMNVDAGLTPASTPYLWITDKFGNQYSEQVAINGDGSFDIDISLYPQALFNPNSGWFDIFLSSDVGGQVIVPMTFGSAFNCLKLATTCTEEQQRAFDNSFDNSFA